MHQTLRAFVSFSAALLLGAGIAQAAEEAKQAQQDMDPAKQAAMEAWQKAGTPSEGHKALEPLAGKWNFTMEHRMSPQEPAETSSGTAENAWIYGGRFLQQKVNGDFGGMPFEGTGLTGYDNIRNEYQTVWYDNMSTGLMKGTGTFDVATKTLNEQGEFSCPMTGEKSMKFRGAWKIIDDNNLVYESYQVALDGKEFKAMEIKYTRAS